MVDGRGRGACMFPSSYSEPFRRERHLEGGGGRERGRREVSTTPQIGAFRLRLSMHSFARRGPLSSFRH
jgi:hypothetical protein